MSWPLQRTVCCKGDSPDSRRLGAAASWPSPGSDSRSSVDPLRTSNARRRRLRAVLRPIDDALRLECGEPQAVDCCGRGVAAEHRPVRDRTSGADLFSSLPVLAANTVTTSSLLLKPAPSVSRCRDPSSRPRADGAVIKGRPPPRSPRHSASVDEPRHSVPTVSSQPSHHCA